jgi:5,5'-dehydrodivanillate O-demethylase oxygenase subunit
MLTKEHNERLTRVGPGTPMGDLMRRYWHPIAALSQMKERDTLPIRLLGEDLVLYRDLSGTYGLLEARCPHRSMSLVYGIPEKCGLRCPYHGWAFDETGACIEQPYEETEDPDARFKDKVTTKAYQVQVMGGMVFGYMGPKPAPVLPPWDLFVMDDVMRDIGFSVVPCNWLQIMENSLDPVHLQWLHMYMRNYVLGKLGKHDKQRPMKKHEKIGFDTFEYGIIKRRVLEGNSEADDDWKVGHPVVFPHYLKTGNTFQIRVPMDDNKTAYWWYRCFTKESGVTIEPQALEDIPMYNAPVPLLDDSGLPQWDILDNNSGQDIVAWITQGNVTDRTRETLGRSDKGIIQYRKLLDQALTDIENGKDPMNVFRSPMNRIDLPTEQIFLGNTRNMVDSERTGNTAKYSPILQKIDEERKRRSA